MSLKVVIEIAVNRLHVLLQSGEGRCPLREFLLPTDLHVRSLGQLGDSQPTQVRELRCRTRDQSQHRRAVVPFAIGECERCLMGG